MSERSVVEAAAHGVEDAGYRVVWLRDPASGGIPHFYAEKDGQVFHVRGFRESAEHLVDEVRQSVRGER